MIGRESYLHDCEKYSPAKGRNENVRKMCYGSKRHACAKWCLKEELMQLGALLLPSPPCPMIVQASLTKRLRINEI